jgi:hypothetical protein
MCHQKDGQLPYWTLQVPRLSGCDLDVVGVFSTRKSAMLELSKINSAPR